MMKKTYLILIALCALVASGMGQEKKRVSGIVRTANQQELSGVSVRLVGTAETSTTDSKGRFEIQAEIGDTLLFSCLGFEPLREAIRTTKMDVNLTPEERVLEEVVVQHTLKAANRSSGIPMGVFSPKLIERARVQEEYAKIDENRFISPLQEALSTFAVDVDGASYSNIRRMINAGQLPPKDAVRVEEMINYFAYEIPRPESNQPVAVVTELGSAPWNTSHQLLRVALRAKDMPKESLPSANLVFLIDVSGSMYGHSRLPLVKSSLKLLVDQLRDQDRVAIVTYSGTASVKLSSIQGDRKMRIKQAIDELEAGGSTAGGAGLELAYRMAKKNFIKNGNNRVILATDGDFNVGASSDEEMEDWIVAQRKSGISLTVLGFGMGNLKDSKMELLANKGHGNYAYIDDISEARKAIVTEFGGSLFTVAKDVKVQVEFNPAYVQAYRLVGYENRLLEANEFNDDTKMGGDMGVGHTVTALYEIIPIGLTSSMIAGVDPLKYQSRPDVVAGEKNNELATVKFRYKDIKSEQSELQETIVMNETRGLDQLSEDFRFSSAVAEYGMLLRDSDFKQGSSFEGVLQRAAAARTHDKEGYRRDFIKLVENTQLMMSSAIGDSE